MNWICYLVDKIARFWGGNDSSFVNFQSNLNNPPLKNVGGIKVALFSIHSELLTKEDAVKVLQVVDDAVASEFVNGKLYLSHLGKKGNEYLSHPTKPL